MATNDRKLSLAAIFEDSLMRQLCGALRKHRYHKFLANETTISSIRVSPGEILQERAEEFKKEILWLTNDSECEAYLHNAADVLLKGLGTAGATCSKAKAMEAFQRTFGGMGGDGGAIEERIFVLGKRGVDVCTIRTDAWDNIVAFFQNATKGSKPGPRIKVFSGLHHHHSKVNLEKLVEYTGNFSQEGASSDPSRPGFFEFFINLIGDTSDDSLKPFNKPIEPTASGYVRFDRRDILGSLSKAWGDACYGSALDPETRRHYKFGSGRELTDRLTETALGYLAVVGDTTYFKLRSWLERRAEDFTLANIGIGYAHRRLGLAIGRNEGSGLGGSDQLFGTPNLNTTDDKIPTTVTSEDMAMLQEILLANGSHAHASRDVEQPRSRNPKRQRTDDNQGAVVDLTSSPQTEPRPIRAMPQGATPVAHTPYPVVPVKVEKPKGDNSLLFIGLAALGGFFLLR